MKSPKVRMGFIIFRPGMEEEIERETEGHWWTARKWIKTHNMENLYNDLLERRIVMDEEDFLTDYVGAIKLHNVSGKRKCYIPKITFSISSYKSSLKRYFRQKGYYVYGDISQDNIVHINTEELSKYGYNRTVIPEVTEYGTIVYKYNPSRIGD